MEVRNHTHGAAKNGKLLQMKILLEDVKNKAVEIMNYLHTKYHLG